MFAAAVPDSPNPPRKGGLPLMAWIGFLLSAGCLVYFFRDVSWGKLSRAFREANYLFLLPTLALNLATYPIRVYRWYYLLPKEPASTFRNRFSATAIGFMATSIFPLRAGELVRAVTFSWRTRIPVGTCLASIVLERLFDLIIVLLCLGLCLAWFPVPAQSEAAALIGMAKKAGGVFSCLVVLIVVFVFLLKVRPNWVLVPTRCVLGFLPKTISERADNLIASILSGLTIVQGLGVLLWLLILSIVHWTVSICGIWFCARAFHVEISFLGATLIFVFSALSVALPQAPGFLGVFQVAIEAALKVLGASPMDAKGLALVYWGLSVVPITLVGFMALYLEGWTLSQVRAETTKA